MTRAERSRGPSLARGFTAAVGALALCLSLPAAASTASAPDGEDGVLSNERTLTYWAHPVHGSEPIRAKPSTEANRVAKTHPVTEDGFPEVYLVLRSHSTANGNTWLKLRIPMRPNGGKGWVRESALGPLNKVRTRLVVDRSDLRATLYRRGNQVWSSPVGIGAASTPTPTGNFWIREEFKTGDNGGLYGPLAFGTSAYSVLSDWPGGGVIGIHGTNQPALIPGRPSHGCIRVPNDAITRLAKIMPLGTPVLIR